LILAEEELEKIKTTAADCIKYAHRDEISNLIKELKDQQKQMEARLDNIKTMVDDLQYVNQKEERKTDEVRSFVQDMLRVFTERDMPAGSGKGSHYPIGYSGDIGKGATTAYDALPPKKWSPAEKTNK
jgi:seryl-tRNA synthetase